jgi:hypothetical protein
MIIRFYYRQIFSFFFLLSFSIIIIFNGLRGRAVFEDTTTSVTYLLICFGYGVLGLIVNFLLKLIFTNDNYAS